MSGDNVVIGASMVFTYTPKLLSIHEYLAHSGQTVVVERELTTQEYDRAVDGLRMYMVRATDSWLGEVYETELSPVP